MVLNSICCDDLDDVFWAEVVLLQSFGSCWQRCFGDEVMIENAAAIE